MHMYICVGSLLILVAIVFCRYLSCIDFFEDVSIVQFSEIPSIQELTKPEFSKLELFFSLLSQHSMAYSIDHSYADT